MAKYLDFKYRAESAESPLKKKLDFAPVEHAQAVLKAYALLGTAEKRGLLDLLRGAIEAEEVILAKVAEYANTSGAIKIMRNLLVLGKLFGSVDPDVLEAGVNDLTEGVVAESKKEPSGVLATVRRVLSGDALRGLAIAMAALESLGRTARSLERK